MLISDLRVSRSRLTHQGRGVIQSGRGSGEGLEAGGRVEGQKLEELQEKVQTLQKKVAQQEVAGERMMADHNGKFHAVKAKLEGYALAQGKDIPMTESPLRSWPACKKQVRDEIDE